MSQSLAQQWEQQLNQRRAAQKTAQVTFAGFPVVARRVGLDVWTKAGRVPQFFFEEMWKAQDGKEPDRSEMTPEDIKRGVKFQRDMVCETVVEPKIVAEDRPLEAGEVSYSELVSVAPDFVDELMRWVVSGCPDVPVETTKGETTVEAVANFRKSRKKSASAGVGGDV